MIDELPAVEIGQWVYKEYQETHPDIVVPIGHRIFDLLLILNDRLPELKDLLAKVVDITALSYIDFEDKRIMLIDEETEYARKFIYDVFPQFEGSHPRSVCCFTIFLCGENEAEEKRFQTIREFKSKHPAQSIFAVALEYIKPYKRFEDSGNFHTAIYLFRKFIESNLRRPYNVDATIFRLSISHTYDMEKKLSGSGPIFSYSDDKFTFLPLSFRQSMKVFDGIGIKDGGLPKLRFFRINKDVLLVSPMAYLPIKFDIDFDKSNWEEQYKDQELLYEMLKAWKATIRSDCRTGSYVLRLYDIVAFFMDVELFRFLIQLLRKAEFDFQFTLDHASCISHYGERLGETLAKLIDEHLSKSLRTVTDSDFRVDYRIDAAAIKVDPATLIAMKAACLESYSKNGEMTRRRGLTFSGMQKRLGMDDMSVSVGIDLLCDSAFLKPFDGLEADREVARFYNTDVEEFIGIFVKLLRRAETRQIPVGKININKFTTFLAYFPLSLFESVQGQIRVIDAPEGKVAHISQDDDNTDEKLEGILTSFPKYSKVFGYESGEFKIKDNAFESEHDFAKHMTIIESESLFDIYLDILFELYESLVSFLKKHPEIKDSKDKPRTIYDVFPGLIELMGKDFPEGGLEIVGVLTKKALRLYEQYLTSGNSKHKDEADELVLNSVPHKILMYQQFSKAYFECYTLMSRPFDSNRGKVWEQMCVFPESSLILELADNVIKTIQSNLPMDIVKIERLKEAFNPILDLMIDLSSTRRPWLESLTPNTSGNWYISSIDIQNSTKLDNLYDPRWKKTKKFFRNIVYRWAELFNGRLINVVGDEIFVAFPDFDLACRFTSATCTHINELADSINASKAFRNLETGSYAKIIFGTVSTDAKGDCDSSEIDIMCKFLPKIKRKIVIDEKTVGVHKYPQEIRVVADTNRPYFVLDPRDEFKRLILSKIK
jgi:hypothetical protein